jgi:hypothetical protein
MTPDPLTDLYQAHNGPPPRPALNSPLTNWTRIESMHVGVVQIET